MHHDTDIEPAPYTSRIRSRDIPVATPYKKDSRPDKSSLPGLTRKPVMISNNFAPLHESFFRIFSRKDANEEKDLGFPILDHGALGGLAVKK